MAGPHGTGSVTNNGSVVTRGTDAIGVSVQSVGGGRGKAGKGGATAGGTNAATNQGSITTYGAHSDAIYAQSVGGGGGAPPARPARPPTTRPYRQPSAWEGRAVAAASATKGRWRAP